MRRIVVLKLCTTEMHLPKVPVPIIVTPSIRLPTGKMMTLGVVNPEISELMSLASTKLVSSITLTIYVISEKSVGGKSLKALELPGLWNGAMAHWMTLFVEIPIITFNPVKTINDLLRNEHQ